MAVAGSEDAVRSVVMDYVEGWFEGDAGQMKRRFIWLATTMPR
jgi:hypothetical protein